MTDVTTASTKRLEKEAQSMEKGPPQCFSAGPVSKEDLYVWRATLEVPAGSIYESGVFHLAITFSGNYPFIPPKIRFSSPVFHPNVDRDGNIRLDILGSQWSPALTMDKVLIGIVSMLDEPNPKDPLNSEAAELFLTDRAAFCEKARKHILE